MTRDEEEILAAAWRDVDSSFERFCLTPGIGAIEQMLCEDAQLVQEVKGRRHRHPWWLGEIVGAVHHVGTKALDESIDCHLQLALPNTGAEQIELNQIVDAD